MESLDILANNIANANTTGFKADREFYNFYTASEATASGDLESSTSPVVEKHWTDFSQGVLKATGNPLDLSISGDGFFVVNGADGPLYTRNGNFQIGKSGQLQTSDGKTVRKQGGGTIALSPSKDVTISADGSITQDGVATGRLDVVDIPDKQGLSKMGTNYFALTDVKTLVRAAGSSQVQQGSLEAANSAPAEHAIRLIGIMRQFESLQKAITIAGDMNRKAVEEVARVSA